MYQEWTAILHSLMHLRTNQTMNTLKTLAFHPGLFTIKQSLHPQ